MRSENGQLEPTAGTWSVDVPGLALVQQLLLDTLAIVSWQLLHKQTYWISLRVLPLDYPQWLANTSAREDSRTDNAFCVVYYSERESTSRLFSSLHS